MHITTRRHNPEDLYPLIPNWLAANAVLSLSTCCPSTAGWSQVLRKLIWGWRCAVFP